MNKSIIYLITLTVIFYSCGSFELKDSQKYDYFTRGALTEDCFQAIITIPPDADLKTMTDQRENSFIKAKQSIAEEIEKQILSYYAVEKSVSIKNISEDRLKRFKEKSIVYSKQGVIEQEYYLIDNSVVLVYRIFLKGIKSEILNN